MTGGPLENYLRYVAGELWKAALTPPSKAPPMPYMGRNTAHPRGEPGQ